MGPVIISNSGALQLRSMQAREVSDAGMNYSPSLQAVGSPAAGFAKLSPEHGQEDLRQLRTTKALRSLVNPCYWYPVYLERRSWGCKWFLLPLCARSMCLQVDADTPELSFLCAWLRWVLLDAVGSLVANARQSSLQLAAVGPKGTLPLRERF